MGVYLIQEQGNSEGPIKIGFTSNEVKLRLADLQTGSPVKLHVLRFDEFATQADETSWHRKLKDHRLHGEWFEAAAVREYFPVAERVWAYWNSRCEKPRAVPWNRGYRSCWLHKDTSHPVNANKAFNDTAWGTTQPNWRQIALLACLKEVVPGGRSLDWGIDWNKHHIWDHRTKNTLPGGRPEQFTVGKARKEKWTDIVDGCASLWKENIDEYDVGVPDEV